MRITKSEISMRRWRSHMRAASQGASVDIPEISQAIFLHSKNPRALPMIRTLYPRGFCFLPFFRLHHILVVVILSARSVIFVCTHAAAYGTFAEVITELDHQVQRVFELLAALRAVVVHQAYAPAHLRYPDSKARVSVRSNSQA